jgi:CRISPR-associated endoribonuclease Cas2 subtype I-E
MLKRWFIEPRPNVFVGTTNRRTREKTLDYIKRNAADLGMLIISDDNSCQGFKIKNFGDTHRKGVEICGLWLAAEDWVEEENRPF